MDRKLNNLPFLGCYFTHKFLQVNKLPSCLTISLSFRCEQSSFLPHLALSFSHSVHLCVCVFVMYAFWSLCLCRYTHSLCLSASVVRLFVYLTTPVSTSVCLSMRAFVCLYICVCVCVSVYVCSLVCVSVLSGTKFIRMQLGLAWSRGLIHWFRLVD